MINARIFFVLILFSGMISSCGNKTPDLDQRILWHEKFIKSKLSLLSAYPVVDENRVYLFREIFDFTTDDISLLGVDKKTGKTDWTWREIYRIGNLGNDIPFIFSEMKSIDGILAGHDKKYIIGLDSGTGVTKWQTDFPVEFFFEKDQFDDKLYAISHRTEPGTLITLIELDPDSGDYKTLLEVPAFVPGYVMYSLPFTLYYNEAMEKCVVFEIMHYQGSAEPGKERLYNLYNYNLDKGELIFNKVLLNNSKLNRIFVQDDKVFGIGEHLMEFDIHTGATRTQLEMDEISDYFTTLIEYPFLYIMFNQLTNRLVKINLSTFGEEWRTSINGHQGRSMLNYGNKIIVCGADGLLYLVDKDTGALREVIHAPFEDQNENLFFNEFMTIDPETGYLYITDFENVYCYDLND